MGKANKVTREHFCNLQKFYIALALMFFMSSLHQQAPSCAFFSLANYRVFNLKVGKLSGGSAMSQPTKSLS